VDVAAGPASAAARRAEQAAGKRHHKQRWTVVALVALGLGVAAPLLGALNPWNLLVIDQLLDHPAVGAVVVVAAIGGLWSLHVDRPQALRVGGFVVWGLAGVAVVITAILLATTRPSIIHGWTTPSRFNDVEARITNARYTGGPEIWEVWLASDRGPLASRENHVAVLRLVDRGSHPKAEIVPVAVRAEFRSATQLEVTVDEEVAYQVDFDPHDLHVVRERCFPVSAPAGWGATFGCGRDLSEWQF
jgi:hypothetical protein